MSENSLLFVGSLILYSFAAYYITIVLGLIHNDTLARTALGFFTIYGRDPHLASVGFVWTPLVSLLQIPLLPILATFTEPAYAGPIISVLFGAATLPMLNESGRVLNIDRKIRLLVVLLYGLNPTIILYAATGMSETVFFFFMIVAIHFLLCWASKYSRYTALVLSGVFIAGCFWVRYEAMPLLIAICFAVLIVIFVWHYQNPSLFRNSLEATWITVIIPAVYSIFVWAFFNWLIMNDPFYWLSAEYSNVAFTQKFRSAANPLYQNLLASISYSMVRVEAQFLPFLALIAIVAWISWKNRSLMPSLLSWVPAVLVAFHVYQNYTGLSYGWYRFFTYALPASIPAVFWILTHIDGGTTRRIVEIIVVAGMAASIFTTVFAMSNPEIGKEEVSFMSAIASNGAAHQDESRSWAASRQVASYITDKDLKGSILIDTFQGFAIVLFSKHPEQYVKTQDMDFRDILIDPPGHGIKWILVPKPDEELRTSEWILKTYPYIWEEGTPWAQLYEDFGQWRLYRIVPESR